jgi:hypothetical protein
MTYSEENLFIVAVSQKLNLTITKEISTLQVLGLDICTEIIVGDEMKRGISGGQKKRVTTGMPMHSTIKQTFVISS